MRADVDAVGGFFEDLPVLAFVLAGVMSVAGTASWVSGTLSESDGYDALDRSASRLACSIAFGLQDTGGLPTVESVVGANLSEAMSVLPDGFGFLVSVWSIHPEDGCLLTVSDGAGEPGSARSATALLNVLCDDGIVGILEVRVLVWEA